MVTRTLHGLYVITDHALLGDDLLTCAIQVIQAGACILQYRDKTDERLRRISEARALAAACKHHDVIFLINDDIDLALEIDADGVHLGQQDTDIRLARKKLGPEKIIGITCHSNLDAALDAEKNGADYVAFGRFFPSKTKPEAPPASINILKTAKARLTLPIVAIGGITIDNGKQLIAAGADMLAVIHGIFGAADITQTTQQFARLFD